MNRLILGLYLCGASAALCGCIGAVEVSFADDEFVGTNASYWPYGTQGGNYCRKFLVDSITTYDDTKRDCASFCSDEKSEGHTCACYPMRTTKTPSYCKSSN